MEMHPLYRSMRKNGFDKFLFEVIYQNSNKEYTKNVMEPFYIAEYNSRIGGKWL